MLSSLFALVIFQLGLALFAQADLRSPYVCLPHNWGLNSGLPACKVGILLLSFLSFPPSVLFFLLSSSLFPPFLPSFVF
jgi:hypothetical protein